MHSDPLRIAFVTQTALILLSVAKMMGSVACRWKWRSWCGVRIVFTSQARLMNFDGLRVTFMPCRWVMFPLRAFVDGHSRQCLHQFVDEFFERAPQAICRFVIQFPAKQCTCANLVDPNFSDVINSSDLQPLKLLSIVYLFNLVNSETDISHKRKTDLKQKQTFSDFLGQVINAILDPV